MDGERGRGGISLRAHGALNGSLSLHSPKLSSAQLLLWIRKLEQIQQNCIVCLVPNILSNIWPYEYVARHQDMIPCLPNICPTNLPYQHHSFLHKGRGGWLVQLGGLNHSTIILLTSLMNNPVTSTLLLDCWDNFPKETNTGIVSSLTCWDPKDPRREVLWS